MAEKIRAVVTEDGFEIVGNLEGRLALAEICGSWPLFEDATESRQRVEFTILYAPEL
jgi:hypothetical protein